MNAGKPGTAARHWDGLMVGLWGGMCVWGGVARLFGPFAGVLPSSSCLPQVGGTRWGSHGEPVWASGAPWWPDHWPAWQTCSVAWGTQGWLPHRPIGLLWGVWNAAPPPRGLSDGADTSLDMGAPLWSHGCGTVAEAACRDGVQTRGGAADQRPTWLGMVPRVGAHRLALGCAQRHWGHTVEACGLLLLLVSVSRGGETPGVPWVGFVWRVSGLSRQAPGRAAGTMGDGRQRDWDARATSPCVPGGAWDRTIPGGGGAVRG